MLSWWERKLTTPQFLITAIVSSVVIAAATTVVAYRAPKEAKVAEQLKDQSQVPAKGNREVHPVIIRTIPIVPQPKPDWLAHAKEPVPEEEKDAATLSPPTEPLVSSEAEPNSPRRHQRSYENHQGGNICTRTGGRRVELNHGKSWRCVYRR